MKKIITIFVLFILGFLTLNSTNAYLSKSASYGNIKDAFYTLEVNDKISKEERDFIIKRFYTALYSKNKNPDEMYDLAMKMYNTIDITPRSYMSIISGYDNYDVYEGVYSGNTYGSSKRNTYYNKIKDLFYRLYNSGEISSTKRNNYINDYYKDIYNYNKDPYKVYKEALEKYNDIKDEDNSNYSSSKKNTYYKKIKDLFYRLYNDKYISSNTRSTFINHYYKDIYKYDKNPYSVYKEALDKYNYFKDQRYNTTNEDKYYKKIKDLFYDLYKDDIITSKQRSNYINDYREDIYDYNKNPYDIYKKALRKYNSLKDDDCDDRYDYSDYNNYEDPYYNNYNNYDDRYEDFDDPFIDSGIYNYGNQIDYTGKSLKYFREY